jgi:hypothetical protein
MFAAISFKFVKFILAVLVEGSKIRLDRSTLTTEVTCTYITKLRTLCMEADAESDLAFCSRVWSVVTVQFLLAVSVRGVKPKEGVRMLRLAVESDVPAVTVSGAVTRVCTQFFSISPKRATDPRCSRRCST